MESVIKEISSKMEKTVDNTKNDLSTMRSDRANPAMLDGIMVDYYGTNTPINQMATVSRPEPRLLIVSPWDKSLLKEVEKAINAADIGINPMNDGKVIRIPIPKLNEDRRKELVKQARDKAEQGRISIRNIRRQGNDDLKDLEKESLITEDDLKDGQKSIQDITDKNIQEIDELFKRKESELMTV